LNQEYKIWTPFSKGHIVSKVSAYKVGAYSYGTDF